MKAVSKSLKLGEQRIEQTIRDVPLDWEDLRRNLALICSLIYELER